MPSRTEPETFYLYREYSQKPNYRFAATVVQDKSTPDGFRVVDSHPIVADSVFMHRLQVAMTSPVQFKDGGQDGHIHYTTIETAHPGEPDHFANAIRNVEGCIFGPKPAKGS
jgi:hypothetical protein